MQTPFQDLAELEGWLRWRADAPGTAWSPVPVPQEGSLTETDLFMLRLVWDLAPEGGRLLVGVEDHEVSRRYVEQEDLPKLALPRGWVPGEAGVVRGGPPVLLVGPRRFGNLVELFAFANRAEVGVSWTFMICEDLPAVGRLVDGLDPAREGPPPDPGLHGLTWGVLETPGPARPAALWLRPGALGAAELRARLAAAGETMVEEAAKLAGEDPRRAARKLVARLVGR